MVITNIGALIFWPLVIWAVVWSCLLSGEFIAGSYTTSRDSCNSFDYTRRALQALNERFRTTEGLLESSLRMTSAALDANARALGAIREALETMRRS